jgi:hypothetical protein
VLHTSLYLLKFLAFQNNLPYISIIMYSQNVAHFGGFNSFLQ